VTGGAPAAGLVEQCVRGVRAGSSGDAVTKVVLAGVIAVAAVAGTGCGRKAGDEPPVATPGFTASRDRATLGSPLEVTYRFVATSQPPAGQDYRVFVHFLDSNEELMWTDDHEPPVPTSSWTPGQTIEYSRTLFLPIYPYLGDATIRVGLYSPTDRRRLTLAGEDNGQRAYKVGTLHLLPQSENVFLIYKDGWHPAEISRENAAVEWQWTKGEATIAFRNPRRDATVYLHLDGRPELFARPQRVTVSAADQPLDTFELETGHDVIRKIPVRAEQFGTGDLVDLRIAVDQTFVPDLLPGAQGHDPRVLGVRVLHAFVEPK
jgi:hypothetical protein